MYSSIRYHFWQSVCLIEALQHLSIFSINCFNFIYFRCCEVRIISDVESYCSSCSDADIVNESNDESLDDEGCWMEICDEVDDNEKDFIPRFKMSSSVQSTHLLSNDSINQLLIGDHCVKGRKCMACPNDRDCREMFGTVSEARERIRNFRKKYWNGKMNPVIFSIVENNCLLILMQWKYTTMKRTILYRI